MINVPIPKFGDWDATRRAIQILAKRTRDFAELTDPDTIARIDSAVTFTTVAAGSSTFANTTISGVLNLYAGSSSYITKNNDRFLHDAGTLNNVFLGRNAGTLINTGSQNLGVGAAALSAITTGSANIGIGTSAGTSLTDEDDNTIIGVDAGYNCTGSRNIFLGRYCGYHQTSVNDTLIIDVRQRSTASDEQTTSLIFGKMGPDTASQNLRVNADIEIPPSHTYNIGYKDTDGSWRFAIDGNNLLIQRRESGSWVTKETIIA